MSTGRWWQPLRSVRARVTLAYALGALLLSSAVAVSTFFLAQNQLLSEAERSRREQAIANARDIRANIGSPPQPGDPENPEDLENFDGLENSDDLDPEDLDLDTLEKIYYSTQLGLLTRLNPSQSLLLFDDGRDRQGGVLQRDDIPSTLQETMSAGEPAAEMRYINREGEISYTVSVRLPGRDAVYYERFSLTGVENTLASLRVILVGTAVISSLGGAGLGWYSARRALSPLSRVANHARRIADGDFSTQLELQPDRDLAILTTAFNDMSQAVAHRIERERRFTSDVSHELRTPLTSLAGWIEVLEKRHQSFTPVAQEAVNKLVEELASFSKLIEDLLEISRMEAGAVRLELNPFMLTEFLENAIFQSRSPEIMLHYPENAEKITIVADKRRLFQVMTNLINNANKYADGVTEISLEPIDDNVQIVVDDAGPGVPTADRERIFERFSRSDADGGNRSGGTGFGLGLSLVAEHVRLHGGRAWVTDRIDGQRGARFVVELPLIPPGSDYLDLLEDDSA